MSLGTLAASISDHCRRLGVEVVLSGGASVSIYTRNKYLSYDLDFVLISFVPRKALREAMAGIGFVEDGRHFRHPDTPYIVEFLSPPLSVGEEAVGKISRLVRSGKVLRLLSPTDCVKDRLAAFFHWNDRQSLEQAILVGMRKRIDLGEIRKWSVREGMEAKFAQYTRLLTRRAQPKKRRTAAGELN